ncbi:hypothetical protein STA3757_32810 [Stanieria sp. NIES-3757]|nr:hypothetical protein STA3757_32810 [Stanieria sp. NIES-3757]
MQEKVYNWERFWCPTTGNLNLDYSGFLYDPESKYGDSYNPDLVKFDVISDIPCLILLGEAGIGKTTATKQEYEKFEAKLQRSQDDCLWFSLGDYDSDNSLCNAIFRNDKFKNWLNGTHKLHLFLDSLDEGLLSIKILTRILKREIDNLPCDRLYLRITCRTAEWKVSLTEKFQEKWGKDNVQIYELCPLRQIDVKEAAGKQDIDANKFIEELFDKQAVPLAIKPITLKFLLSTYKKNNCFPLSQKELYEQGCLELCKEVNSDRLDCDFKGKLSDKKRLIVAGRIAAINIFANKVAIWTNPDCAEMPESDIAIQDLCIGKEKIDGQEFDITKTCIEEVLSISGLFSSRGTNRMGFAHKTYAEFLAAWYLTQHQIPLVQIMSLIVSPQDAERKLVPQLHETAAWLASLNCKVLEKIMTTDPDVLLYSDVSEDRNIREAIVGNLLEQYEQEKLFDRGLGNHLRYKKLKHPKLAEQLQPYIQDKNKNFNSRYKAIDIAEVCEVKELQNNLVELALDKTQKINLRANAAAAIVSIGDSNTKLRLKPLAVKELPEDEEDQLKGYGLRAVWSEHLNAKELFEILTPPKKANFYGGYQGFIQRDIVSKLNPEDIIIALNWLEKQGVRCFGHPFEYLGDSILLKAWEHFDNPDIVKGFAKIALVQLKKYQRIITHCSSDKKQFELLIAEDNDKRHKLIKALVLLLSQSGFNPNILLSHATENLCLQKDIFWMIEKIQKAESQEIEKIWAYLIEKKFNLQDAKQINAIVSVSQNNQILKEQFQYYLEAIELNSEQAERAKSIYREMQSYENQKQDTFFLAPSPQERISMQLDKLESGNLESWWLLCRDLSLEPDSRYYDKEFEYDLTKLPGWQNADSKTQTRIINGAKKYLLEQTNIKYDWIGTNNYCRSALAGSKALLLLLSLVLLSKESPDFLNSLSSEIWQRWTPVIIGSFDNSNRKDPYFDLVRLAYEKAPSEAIDTLTILIDSENKDSDYIFATRQFKKCWDERLMSVVLERAKDSSIKPLCMNYLLEELLERNYSPAKDYVKTLITHPLPSAEEARKRAIKASQVLMINATGDLWSVFWSTVQQDKTFGREVLENMMDHAIRGEFFDLTEKQIADFFIWLEENYPHNEDPDYDNAHFVGTRESIGHLRDNVLYRLRDWGTLQACQEIQRIISHFPQLDWLKYVLFDAQKNTRIKTWQPPTSAEIFKLVSDRNKRLVNDGNELLDVLIEVMNELQVKLHAQTPAVIDLWNEIKWTQVRKLADSLVKQLKVWLSLEKTLKIDVWKEINWRKINGNAYIPKDEERLSDYIVRYLKDYLGQKGIVVNREVEIRRGEITDIQVDAVIKKASGEIFDSITAIIEVKGCWHNELNTAMETQLVNRYLKDSTCQHGLYLVGWFNCDQWNDSDSRKGKAPKINIEEARQQFTQQAEQISQSNIVVKAFVLNAALR